jgi:hypothetical protein
LVDGGDGYDVCIVNENDTPVVNCERIQIEPNPEPSPNPTATSEPSAKEDSTGNR